jgi:hypothetical protein
MDIRDYWEKALKQTEIVRPRVLALGTFESTRVPYIFLGESAVNIGDTVVRRGEVLVERPSLILPPNVPSFEGFETGESRDADLGRLADFLMVRGVRFPSVKYNNKIQSVDLREGKLRAAVDFYAGELQRAENISTGLVVGPEDCWQFSVLIFTCSTAERSAENDIRRLFEKYRGGL